MVSEDELREQLIDAVEDATYPINGPLELLPVLPEGPATTIDSGEFSITAMELTTEIPQGALDFPYESPETFADDVVEKMHEFEVIE